VVSSVTSCVQGWRRAAVCMLCAARGWSGPSSQHGGRAAAQMDGHTEGVVGRVLGALLLPAQAEICAEWQSRGGELPQHVGHVCRAG